MSESSSSPEEEANKKIRYDAPSSSGRGSSVNQFDSNEEATISDSFFEDSSEEGASAQESDSRAEQRDGTEEGPVVPAVFYRHVIPGLGTGGGEDVPGASVVGDNLSLLTEDKPRNQDDTQKSSGSAPASGSSHSSGGSASTTIVYKKRTLRYKKSLSPGDVSRGELMIPIQYGRKFLPEPEEHDGIYETINVSFLDHNRQIWPMEAYFSERTSSYMLGLNWDRYVKKFNLKPEDMIFVYHDPVLPTYDQYLIEFERKRRDSNPTVGPSNPTEGPSDPTEGPSNPTEKPSDPTTEMPSDPTEKPSDPTTEKTGDPSDPTEKPSDPTEKPSDPTEKPSDPTTGKPCDPTTEKPSDPTTEKPSDPTEKPSDPKDTT